MRADGLSPYQRISFAYETLDNAKMKDGTSPMTKYSERLYSPLLEKETGTDQWLWPPGPCAWP